MEPGLVLNYNQWYFPRHNAAASLKLVDSPFAAGLDHHFPRHNAAASLKHCDPVSDRESDDSFSAAQRRGLIEADRSFRLLLLALGLFSAAQRRGLIEAAWARATAAALPAHFPRHNAAASLKPAQPAQNGARFGTFSAAQRRGLIEATISTFSITPPVKFSAAQRRGLIEALSHRGVWSFWAHFPRHNAAASLKRDHDQRGDRDDHIFRGTTPRPH